MNPRIFFLILAIVLSSCQSISPATKGIGGIYKDDSRQITLEIFNKTYLLTKKSEASIISEERGTVFPVAKNTEGFIQIFKLVPTNRFHSPTRTFRVIQKDSYSILVESPSPSIQPLPKLFDSTSMIWIQQNQNKR